MQGGGRKKRFHTEGAEVEHREHGEEKPKSTARNGCATGSEVRMEIAVTSDFGNTAILPRSLRSVAGAPHFGAEEKAGHSGRDDSFGRFATRKRKMFVIGLRA